MMPTKIRRPGLGFVMLAEIASFGHWTAEAFRNAKLWCQEKCISAATILGGLVLITIGSIIFGLITYAIRHLIHYGVSENAAPAFGHSMPLPMLLRYTCYGFLELIVAVVLIILLAKFWPRITGWFSPRYELAKEYVEAKHESKSVERRDRRVRK